MSIKTIALNPATGSPPSAVRESIDLIGLSTTSLAKTVTPAGGVSVGSLREVLLPIARELHFTNATGTSFGTSSLTWVAPERRTAITIQAGRAHVNNGVLVATLAAADHPDAAWLIAVVPKRYKDSPTFQNLSVQIQALQAASGVHLDLHGVTLIGF